MSADERMPLSKVLKGWADGDEIGWPQEFAYLRQHQAARIAALTVDLAIHGQQAPISLGPDGRVWDGHHRLCVLDALNGGDEISVLVERIPPTTPTPNGD